MARNDFERMVEAHTAKRDAMDRARGRKRVLGRATGYPTHNLQWALMIADVREARLRSALFRLYRRFYAGSREWQGVRKHG